MLVKDVEEVLHTSVKISELPDIIRYRLPQRFRGIREHLQYDFITEDQFSEFFKSLEEMWNFLDCDLLCHMVKKYGKPEHQSRCRNYESKIEHFCSETTISDLIKYWKPRFTHTKIPSELKSCVMEFSWNPDTKKVKDLREIQHRLKAALPQELAMAAYWLGYVNNGSVIVLWFVWDECLSQVMIALENLLKTQPEFITDNEITFLSLDENVLFASSNDKVCVYRVHILDATADNG